MKTYNSYCLHCGKDVKNKSRVFCNECKKYYINFKFASGYKFVSIRELAYLMAYSDINSEFSFTFDTEEDIESRGEPTGIYGVKITKIFDEELGVLCFGYYGGYCTRCIDMDLISDDTRNIDCNRISIEKQLVKWFEGIEGYTNVNGNQKICLLFEQSYF